MSSLFRLSRQGFQTCLNVTTIACGVIASFITIILLISGTTTTPGGNQVFLKSLALSSVRIL